MELSHTGKWLSNKINILQS